MAWKAIRIHIRPTTTLESGHVLTWGLGPKHGRCRVVLRGSSSQCQKVDSEALGTHVTRWINLAWGPIVGPTNGFLVTVV